MDLLAKFELGSITEYPDYKRIEAEAVYGDEGENKDFTDATPSGSLSLGYHKGTPADQFFNIHEREFFLRFSHTEKDFHPRARMRCTSILDEGNHKEVRLQLMGWNGLSPDFIPEGYMSYSGTLEMTIWSEGAPVPAASWFEVDQEFYMSLSKAE